MKWAGDGGARAGIRDEAGLTLCSVAICALAEVESDTKLLEQKYEDKAWAGLFLLSMCLQCSQH